MKPNERNKKINDLRGEFIGKMLYIEILLSKVLSIYIAPEKIKYIDFMFTKLDINKKIEIYKQILKDKDPSFVRYSYSKLLTDIKDMQDVRNLFAHSLADINFYGFENDVPKLSDKISFRNAKNMERDFFTQIANEYKLSDHNEHMDKMEKIANSLFDVMYHYNRAHPPK